MFRQRMQEIATNQTSLELPDHDDDDNDDDDDGDDDDDDDDDGVFRNNFG